MDGIFVLGFDATLSACGDEKTMATALKESPWSYLNFCRSRACIYEAIESLVPKDANMPDCNDRQFHAYAGPCHANRQPCCHDHQFEVCDNCHDDTQVILGLHLDAPNFCRIAHRPERYTPAPPRGHRWPPGTPPLPAWPGSAGPLIPPPNPPFDGFMTRVCQDCELRLQSLRELYRTRVVIPENESLMFAPPVNTCTCAMTLGIGGYGPRRCFRHRRELWRSLEERKNRNDRWLRNTERNASGQVVQASDATKALRRRLVTAAAPIGEATWRACRCGKTCERTTFNQDPTGAVRQQEVWLCMGCEGFLSRIAPTAARSVHHTRLITNPRRLRNKHRLGRVRSDGTR